MKIAKLEKMIKGWFVGHFEPTLYKTEAVEVGVKIYKAGTHESWHYHKIATEITVIISGRVRMNGKEFSEGDIVVIEPGEGSDFEVLEDTVTTVVKLPGVRNDKYLRDE
jgi:mannose-6-phosphate isomerase-like protein (cupin superfamily)